MKHKIIIGKEVFKKVCKEEETSGIWCDNQCIFCNWWEAQLIKKYWLEHLIRIKNDS